MNKLLCPKHHRILIGKKMCEECEWERVGKAVKEAFNCTRSQLNNRMKQRKCLACGTKLKSVKDPITNKISKYLWKCPNCKYTVSIG